MTVLVTVLMSQASNPPMLIRAEGVKPRLGVLPAVQVVPALGLVTLMVRAAGAMVAASQALKA